MAPQTEKERNLLEMNANLRRVLFHLVRQHGGTVRVSMHDMIKYSEAGEALRWRTDLATGDYILSAEYLLGTPASLSLGEGEMPQPLGIFATYRVLFGEVWRTFTGWLKDRKNEVVKTMEKK